MNSTIIPGHITSSYSCRFNGTYEGFIRKTIMILGSLLFCTTVIRAQIPPVVISEVFYDTPLSEDLHIGVPTHNGEFIEFFNPANEVADISGWMLRDGDSNRQYIFPEGSTIPPRSTILLVYRHSGTPHFSIRELFDNISPAQESSSVIYHSTIRLTNDGDKLTLKTSSGKEVDYVSWRPGKGWRTGMGDNWPLKACNGEGYVRGMQLQSIQRKDIHASSSQINALKEDFETAPATPLKIPDNYNLPVLDVLYGSEQVNTNLPVGTLPGSASVTPAGAATYQIPIEVPPGTNGVQPQISIVYNSQGGFGALGQGWDISGTSSISRGTQSFYYDGDVLDATSIQFNDKDRLYLDGQRLILLSGTHLENNAEYATEMENYARIKLTKNGDDTYFILTTRDGSVMEYGKTDDSRLENSNTTRRDLRVLGWKLNKSTDIFGNTIEYEYSDYGQYISKIKYTGTENYIRFDYIVNDKNPRKRYINSFMINQSKLLSSIETYSAGQKVKSYKLDYIQSDSDMRLDAVTEYIGNVCFNSTKIGWGAESKLQLVDIVNYTAGNLINVNNAFLYTGDIDGDGYGDLIEVWTGSEWSDKYGYEASTLRVISTKDNSVLGSTTFHSCTHNYSFFVPKLVVGDINKDGKDEIMLIEQGQMKTLSYNTGTKKLTSIRTHTYKGSNLWRYNEFYRYNAFLADVNGDEYPDLVIAPYIARNSEKNGVTNSYDTEVFLGTSTGLSSNSIPYSTTVSDKNGVWCAPMAGDFDADGKMDFMHITTGSNSTCNSSPFRISESQNWNDHLFRDNNGKHCRFWRLFPVDFNNDGRTDILVQQPKDGYDGQWFFLRNNGGSDRIPTREDVAIQRGHDKYDGEMSDIFILDYNGDGMPDIVFADESYSKENKFSHHEWYFYRNKKGSFEKDGNTRTSYDRIMKMRPVVMDINRDGIADLVFTDGKKYRAYTMPNAGKRNLVHKITNGLGQSHHFTYKNYTNYDLTPTTGAVSNLKIPMTVVDYHISPAGHKTLYTFANGKVHKYKGFLGFMNVKTENTATKIKNITEYKIDNTLFNLLPARQYTYVGEKLTSSSVQEYEVVKVDTKTKRYISRIKKESITDEMKNAVQSNEYKYDSNHNITEKYTRTGSMFSTTYYWDYQKRNNMGDAYLPGTVYISFGHSTLINKTTYEYNPDGTIKKKTEYPGTENEVITEYTYYAAGNLNTVKVTPKERTAATTIYEYDPLFRAATGVVNALGQRSSTEYDFTNGNILSETGINGLITRYEYNNAGRLYKTCYPNGEVATESINWSNDAGALYLKQITNNKVNNRIVSYYDYLGREVLSKQTGANGQELVSKKEYSPTGQLIKVIHPAASREPERYTSYGYDEFGRVTAEHNFDGNKTLTTSYRYDGSKTTVYYPDGTSAYSVENDRGLISRREDEGGMIEYEYDAAGQLIVITSNGSSTYINYDEFGNQTTLVDPNAGKIKYTYYAGGLLKSQVDASGDSTVMEYDKAWRLLTKTLYDKSKNTETKSVYSYKASGKGIGQVASILHYEDGVRTHTQAFIYNDNHQQATFVDRYENINYIFRYTYDELWRPLTTTSPSGLVTENEYDEYGNIQKIKTGTQIIWELKEQNARGQITAFDLGNGVNTQHTYYDNGLLKRQYARNNKGVVMQDMNYEYDADTYSLTLRNDVKNQRRELFHYDELDRLTSTRLNGVLTDSVSYRPNGNILTKTDVGTYQYDRTRPHAMSGIQGSTLGEAVTGIMQEITYTPFNKVKSVQHSRGDNDRYEISYGLDQQRIKSSYYRNGVKQYDRYYFGTYEKEVDKNGNTTHIDYIYAPTGLTAVIRNTGTSKTLHYLHTDNLGSIQTISSLTGNLTTRYAYTAWGGQIKLSGTDGITNRGYTGHEHLEPLGLINMNGRIYDPTLARFLSPDPYVQAPDYTQGFNRYSYCLNNPFKYTDPSGEFLTWSFSRGGLSIGFNLTPIGIPVGGGLNFGWSDGFSIGTYSEIGYRVGGTGLGAGATFTQSFDYNFKYNNLTSTSTVGAYGSFAMFNAGASGSYYYDMTNGQGGFGWNVNAGMGLGGNYAGGLGLNVSYGSGGFSYGLGGSYNPWATKPQVSVYDANIEALKKLWEATRPIRERLAESVPLLTLQSEIKEQNTYYAGNLVGSGREVVAIAFVSGKFYIDKAVNKLNLNAYYSYADAVAGGEGASCARFVRMALEAGGINTSNRPKAARQYGPYLKRWGFTAVNTSEYQKGDIAVFQGYPGGTADPKTGIPYGHIQMYNGSKWVSNYIHSGFWPGKGYRDNTPFFRIYRWPQ